MGQAPEQHENVITLVLRQLAGESSPWTVRWGLGARCFLIWRAEET